MKVACYRDFLTELLPALAAEAAAVKIQIAYFEALGARGYALYEEMVRLAQGLGYLVIADVKRGDIGSTAEAYARAHLDVAGRRCGHGQSLLRHRRAGAVLPALPRSRARACTSWSRHRTRVRRRYRMCRSQSGEPVYERVAELVDEWGRETVGTRGYRSIGAVVGGTHPEQGASLRKRLAGVPFLIPGYGAQGATAGRPGRVCSMPTGQERWSTRRGPSSTPTRRPRAGIGWTPPETKRRP